MNKFKLYISIIGMFCVLNGIAYAEEANWNEKMYSAIKNNDVEETKTCLKNGASINFVDGNNATMLMRSMSEYGEILPELLIKLGADIRIRDKYEYTALAHAVIRAKPKTTKLLIEKGADINATEYKGNTPLMLVLVPYIFSQEIVDILLAAEPNLRIRNNAGKSAYDLAKKHGYDEVAKKILEKDPLAEYTYDQIYKPNSQGRNLLMRAAYDGKGRTIKAILEEKNPELDINLKDNNGLTALMLSAYCGCPVTTKVLLDAGADLSALDKNGRPALFYAVERESVSVVKQLMDIDPNQELLESYFKAYFAKYPLTTVVESYLMEALVNPDNVLLFAAKYVRLDFLKIALKYGANANALDSEGNPALVVLWLNSRINYDYSSTTREKYHIDMGQILETTTSESITEQYGVKEMANLLIQSGTNMSFKYKGEITLHEILEDRIRFFKQSVSAAMAELNHKHKTKAPLREFYQLGKDPFSIG